MSWQKVHLPRLPLDPRPDGGPKLALLCFFSLAVPTCGAETILGAAMARDSIWTWSANQVLSWPLGGGTPRLLARGQFGPSGCIADVDANGRDDLVVQERPGPSRLVWLKMPGGRQGGVIETETDFADCLAMEMYGKRGVVFAHFHSQVRFYEFPSFRYQELYSIYTASQQGGLLLSDVDSDGHPDLFIGNYWMRNPGAFHLSWRLFAINDYYRTPQAALARIALLTRPGKAAPDLVWAESRGAPAKVVLLERPADIRQLWIAHPLVPEVHEPRGLLTADSDGDGAAEIYVGGRSRVLRWQWRNREQWVATTLAEGFRTLALFSRDGVIFAVTPSGVKRLGRVD